MKKLKIIPLIILALLFTSCSSGWHSGPHSGESTSSAVAKVYGLNNSITGIVLFEEDLQAKTMNISVDIKNLPANESGLKTKSLHGFHIHQYGDCTAPDGKSAGGHFSLEGQKHLGPERSKRHLGDLGNLTAYNGEIRTSFTDPILSLNGASSIIGRSVILHAGKDDLVSQPSGQAGPRIACGVIGIRKASE